MATDYTHQDHHKVIGVTRPFNQGGDLTNVTGKAFLLKVGRSAIAWHAFLSSETRSEPAIYMGLPCEYNKR